MSEYEQEIVAPQEGAQTEFLNSKADITIFGGWCMLCLLSQ